MDTNVTTTTTVYNSSTWEYDQSTFTENISSTDIGTTWYTTDETFLSTEQVGTLTFSPSTAANLGFPRRGGGKPKGDGEGV